MNHLQLPNGLQTGYISRVYRTIGELRKIKQSIHELGRDVHGLVQNGITAHLGVDDDGNIASTMTYLDYPEDGWWLLRGECNLMWLYTGEDAPALQRWSVCLVEDNAFMVLPKANPLGTRGLKDILKACDQLPDVGNYKWLDLPEAILQVALKRGFMPIRLTTHEHIGRELVLRKDNLCLVFELSPGQYQAGVERVEAAVAQWKKTHD